MTGKFHTSLAALIILAALQAMLSRAQAAGEMPAAPADAPWNESQPTEAPAEQGSPWNGMDAGLDPGPGDSPGLAEAPGSSAFFVRGEYLLWWMKGDSLPPLVTTSPTGTVRSGAGVVGLSDTTVLFGGDTVNQDARSGGRVVLGYWMDPASQVEAEFFGLGKQRSTFDATSDGSTILARPFYNLTTGAQDSYIIAFPGQQQGTLHAEESSTFLGAGINATQNLFSMNYCGDRHYRVDILYGFRYLRLAEDLSINDSTTSIDPNGSVPVGTNFKTSDSFTTTNDFYGADLGLATESRSGCWSLTSTVRLGLGETWEHANVAGSSSATLPGGSPSLFQGGLLAMPTNIGGYSHDAFSFVPRLELKLAYDLNANLRFTFGYDLMWWSNVVRPGDQIDTSVNTSQASGQPLVGTAGPLFSLHESDLWVQGISAGAELRF